MVAPKKYVAAALLCFACREVVGQFEKTFARLSPQDVDMKECTFDPGASAVVLLDEGLVDYDSFGEIDYRHTRIKILKNDALHLAQFSIVYRSKGNNVIIEDLKALSININEDGTSHEFPIDKKSIYERKINGTVKQLSFAFPEVRIGTILEYTYSVHYTGYGKPDDWEFQQEFPVCSSSFKVKSPAFLPITYSLQKWPESKVVINEDKENKTLYFEMKDIPSMSEEPYMDSKETYVQKVGFHKLRSYNLDNWKELTSMLMDADWFGKQLKVKLAEPEASIVQGTSSLSAVEKMTFVYNYVRKNISWNEYTSIAPPNGLKEVWETKKGSSGSVNLLLVKLLKAAGLEAYPMLVSERGNGKINVTRAYLDQFNTLYAAVLIDGRKYYLDATSKFTPCFLTPYTSLNSTAYILDNKKGGLTNIEEDSLRFWENIAVDEQLGSDGALSGMVQIISKDYARPYRLTSYEENKKEYVEKVIKNGLENIKIDKFVIENESPEGAPLKQTFAFNAFAQNTGDYIFLDLNLFSAFKTNPFVADKRYSDINFGYKKFINVNVVIALPPDFIIDALPKSLTMVNPDKTVSFLRNVTYNEQSRQIVARLKIELNKTLYTVDEYRDIKEFYKKMIDLFNEPVILKKS